MKVSFKVICVSTMALVLAFSGCGKIKSWWKSKVGSGSGSGLFGGGEDSQEVVKNGRKLIMGIIQANIERESAGLGPVWPRTWREENNASSDDIAQKAFKSAAEYFEALFDMEHYGTSDWDPVVDGELLSTLGKNAVVGKKINPEGLDWCIAANVVDETYDFFPVLVSANVNLALLPTNQFDGQDDRRLPIGRKAGAPKSMFGDSAIVLVRKSGAAEPLKSKYARFNTFYSHQAFDNSNLAHPIVWLTPTGIAEPK